MIIENYLSEIQSTKKLYHIAQQELDGKIVKPKIPENLFTKLGLEDKTIPRISFAPTINQCITAIGNNRIEGSIEKRWIVFEPSNYNTIKIISNKELIRRKLTIDAKYSGEIWVTSTIEFKEIGVIEVIKKIRLAYEIQLPGHKEISKFYHWKYKVLDGDIE